ncbi:MAG: 4-(cytidine 5'-diphospho)-2-C-methyl-D-erythritol kinase [Hyphomicrobiales bacterium]
MREGARPAHLHRAGTGGETPPLQCHETKLAELAPAKINLTLSVKGRRADGFHDIASLVVFASVADELSLMPGGELSLAVTGPFARAAGHLEANLVLKAAGALARRLPWLKQGAFSLDKRLPVAAGLGGGSADAAAALRLLARANGLPFESGAVLQVAEETGSDVPVCLLGGCRMMRGRGEILGPRLEMPRIPAVLVNPAIRLETARVFQTLGRRSGDLPCREFEQPAQAATCAEWLAAIALGGNDLEAPAIRLAPAVQTARRQLSARPGCNLARMTGSGATMVGLFEGAEAALSAAGAIAEEHPDWWVSAVTLAGI